MMNEEEFNTWANACDLSDAAYQFLCTIRESAPTRAVQNQRSNVRGRFASRKMSQTLAFESELELSAMWTCEYDDEVLEFWEQPCEVILRYTLPSGRHGGHRYRPDLCVLRRDGIVMVECKYVNTLQDLVAKQPHLYSIDRNGSYRITPAEEAFEAVNIPFRILTDQELDPTYLRNIEFIADYLRVDTPAVPPTIVEALIARAANNPGVTLLALAEDLPAGATMDHVYTLIASGTLSAPLETVLLRDPRRVTLFPDRVYAQAFHAMAKAGPSVKLPNPQIVLKPNESLAWDGRLWTILNLGDSTLFLRDPETGRTIELGLETVESLLADHRLTAATTHQEDPSPLTALKNASPQALAVALARWNVIRPYVEGIPDLPPLPRNERRWLKAYQEAERNGGSGFMALIPRIDHRGNHTERVEPRHLDLINTVIENAYLTPKQLSASTVWALYQKQAKEAQFIPVSEKTFRKIIKTRPPLERVRARRGRRAANNEKAGNIRPHILSPHADRPWQVAHMDHTQVDVQLTSMFTGKPLDKRPWLTVLMDTYSRRILAAYLSLDPPSTVSCLMALRLCVQRYHRLPQSLVVDNGADFHSTQFEQFLAAFGIHKVNRPPGEPRYGSPVERLFGVANKQFFHLLLGNTQMMTAVRQVTKSVDPRNLAVWTFEQLAEFLDQWAFDVYDQIPHSALGMSPGEAYNRGLQHAGVREHTKIPYDQDFVLLTMPEPKRPAKIRRDGLRILYFDYWTDTFREAALFGQSPPVRYDPFDITQARVYLCIWPNRNGQFGHRFSPV